MKSKGSIFGVLGASGSDSMRRQAHIDLDLHRNCGQVAHAHQIVGRRREGEIQSAAPTPRCRNLRVKAIVFNRLRLVLPAPPVPARESMT